jgi:putative transposase
LTSPRERDIRSIKMAARTKRRRGKHPNWGGRRPGAGRKPKGDKAMVSHAQRAKVRPGAAVRIRWQLARQVAIAEVRPALAAALREGGETEGFRVARSSSRGRVVDLSVVARNAERLARGMQGLAIRFARALNRGSGRKGRVFADRYEVRAE